MGKGTAMTEEEWMACTDPQTMLEFLRTSEQLNQRKARLFACAAVRRIWHLLPDERSRMAVEVSERFADGWADAEDLAHACQAAWDATEGPFDDSPRGQLGSHLHAAMAAWWVSDVSLPSFAEEAANRAYGATVCDPDDPEVEEVAHAALLRDLLGPLLFRPIACDPTLLAYNATHVVKLAESAYAARIMPSGNLDPVRFAILADALEGAGCTDAAILDHLRGPGPHVRGCWAVDLLLDKK